MLTDKQIQAAIRTARTDVTLTDGAAEKGAGSLRLRIRAGAKGTSATWVAWWQEAGRVRTVSLGKYPAVSLSDARALAEKVIGDAKNPLAPDRDPTERTVAKLFGGYIASMKQDGKRSADEVERQLTRALDALGKDTPASDVTPADIAKLLKPIHDRGARVMADRMRAYLSAAFNWAIESENDYRAKVRQNWGVQTNPAATVKRDTGANVTRDRNLSADELAALWRASNGDGFADGTGAAIKLLICCGQRIMETMRVDGADIDLKARLWHMPAHKTKGGKYAHTIPLPSQAVEIFAGLIETHGKGALFPARLNETARQQGTSLNKAMRRWTTATGRESFQGRDMRRTWKSRTADAGIDRFMRDLIQQHAKSGDTGSKHYDRADYLPQMRDAMAKWEAWLTEKVVANDAGMQDNSASK
jgi:integrase